MLKETLLALTFVAVGLFMLPAAVYLVGQRIIGPYEAGLPGFYESIGNALLTGNAYAWVLVLSPYVTILLVRLSLRLRRRRRAVN